MTVLQPLFLSNIVYLFLVFSSTHTHTLHIHVLHCAVKYRARCRTCNCRQQHRNQTLAAGSSIGCVMCCCSGTQPNIARQHSLEICRWHIQSVCVPLQFFLPSCRKSTVFTHCSARGHGVWIGACGCKHASSTAREARRRGAPDGDLPEDHSFQVSKFFGVQPGSSQFIFEK